MCRRTGRERSRAAEPLFEAIARRAFEAGADPAAAAAIKIANNFVLGCAIEAMGEGFALVRKYGVVPDVFYDVMTDGLFAGVRPTRSTARSSSRSAICQAGQRAISRA